MFSIPSYKLNYIVFLSFPRKEHKICLFLVHSHISRETESLRLMESYGRKRVKVTLKNEVTLDY